MADRPPGAGDAPPEVVARLRPVCLALPEAYEEHAWVGTRWSVRKKNFAHVVSVDGGYPPAYARAAETDGPAVVLTFRSAGEELAVLSAAGHPFFRPPWAPNIVGMLLGPEVDDVDWDEVEELVTESYCLLAPAKLAARVDRPEG
jgi:YjbR